MDWHNVAGTGAFMVTDYVAGNSVTMSKNPDYYLYDERYPENKLPYLDTLKVMGIIDPSTQLAAIRSGQVDMVTGLDWQIAQNLEKTNPEIILTTRPFNGFELDTRCDKEPFTDIRVRKALQLAVDTQTIAKTHFGGLVSGNPAGLFTADYGGWAFNYEDWPADLQKEYSYDPEQARQLLAEAGYPDGFDTNAIIPNEQDMDLMQIIKSYFADIGVDLEIRPVDQNQMVALAAAGQVEQIQYTENINMTWPVHIGLFNLTSTAMKYRTIAPPEGIEVYDELYHQFANAPDEATAQEFARQAQEYVLRQHWTVHTTGRVYYDATQPRLKGFAGEDVTGWNRAWFWNGFWVDDSQK
jgi:peptide/nickel transport system substrate-binding protein